ncbi:MAG TPA: nucleoside hydrolase [Mycobacteriales bacterium]|nr:nucleoside hydrolase [Mycobacteriales bacterium]
MTTPILIDCDPGIDDAVALLLACASPELRLLGVSTVAGNVGLEHTTRNAGRLLALAGRSDVPVAAGAGRPLIRTSPGRAEHVHGEDGVHHAVLPEPGAEPDPRPAVDLLADAIGGSPDPVTLVAIGPLTNVALLYAVHPEVAATLGRVVVMGGSATGGNTTAAAEFNVWSDPEAAYRVLTDPGLSRPVPTTMVGLDLTLTVPFEEPDLAALAAGGAAGRAAAAMLRPESERQRAETGVAALAVHDAVAVLSVLRPELIRTRPATITVDCSDGDRRGATVVTPAPDGSWADVAVGAAARDVVDIIVRRVADYGS